MNIIYFPIKNHYQDDSEMRRKLKKKLEEFSKLKNDFLDFIEVIEKEGKEFLEDKHPIPYRQSLFEEMLQDFDLRKLAAYYFKIPSNQKRMD